MTAVVERDPTAVLVPTIGPIETSPPRRSVRHRLAQSPRWLKIIGSIALINAVLFVIVRPDVNDLWAARARASAVLHGVNVTYWFSWYSGGSTPGNYSVLTPYLSALLTAELVGALSSVAIVVLTAAALRKTRYPAAGTAVALAGVAINLWSGRVPFLLGAALGVGAIIAVLAQRRWLAAALTVLSILASPVAGAFLALGLIGSVLTRNRYRSVSITTIATVVASLGVVALAFGSPGPQHISWLLCLAAIGALILFLFARLPAQLRVVVLLSILTVLGLKIIPNGMGANIGRMIWFCLPVAVVAMSGRRVWIALLLVAAPIVSGARLTVEDLLQASEPGAAAAYYLPLAQQLDQTRGLDNYRVEVVSESEHAAYDALLNHAMLARGWETQEDNALNPILHSPALNATSYKVWLDNNSVGYVAIPVSKGETYPEFTLVTTQSLPYLNEVWRDNDWVLYKVSDASPIVEAPQSVLSFTQSKLIIHSSCVCSFHVRIHYSKYLRADPVYGHVLTAQVTPDPYGYAKVTTSAPGDYVLHGTVTSLFR